MVTIYHNPRCRKSREVLELISHTCKEIKIIDYLKIPPTEKELKSVLKKLGINAEDLVRKGEELYKTKFKNKNLSEEQWVKTLTENPILIERPVVINGEKAVIGRPPEKVNEIL